ncbi:MAG: hypothetical protein ACYC3V_06325 [Chloroflexota bacterium]
MRRMAMRPLWVLGAAIGLLVAACAPSPGDNDAGQFGPSSSRFGTPRAGMATPTGEVMGARATAVATRTLATPGPLRIQGTLREMDRFQDQLRIWSGGTPTPSDLYSMTQRAADLMAELHLEISQMTPSERDQALQSMSNVLLEMTRVVDTHARQAAAMGTPGAMMGGTATPGAMMRATPTAGAGTMGPEQMMAEIDRLRDQEMRLATGQPTPDDIIAILDRMQLVLVGMRQQLTQLSTQELENLTGNLASAMDDLVPVVETHLRQEYGFVPTAASPTPGTPMASPTAMASPTGTPMPTAMASPTDTPMPTATVVPTDTPMPTATVVPTDTPMPTATAMP